MHCPLSLALAAVSIFSAQFVFAETTTLPAVTVTGTREETLLSETPSAVGVIARDAIEFTRAAHPQQLLGQIPGVAIAVTNGEGHTTAIRQGFTTSPLYLFLEDGIPVRATGNYNHNALYELNIPSAGGIEVVRGIGSALYGSDAIAGIVNVLSRTPALTRGSDMSIEAGSFGWARVLGGIDSGQIGSNALRADINLTHTDGWRTKTGYDRQSLNLRWDHESDASTQIKTILGVTRIYQQTGANSGLPLNLYLNDPSTNLRSLAYRKVDAFRLSTSIEKDLGGGERLTLTPYVRDNRMDLNGSYNFTGTPRIENTVVQSFGLMAKWRKNFDNPMRTRFIAGIDLDVSPSTRREDKFSLATDSNGQFYETSPGVRTRIYDYQVQYQSVAPYTQLEISPVDRLRITGGLRFDYASFALTNNLQGGAVVNGFYQPADTTENFSRLSPKLGLTWALTAESHVFASYNQGFRTPAEGQLFRAGATSAAQANAALALKPVRAEQFELGIRSVQHGWSYEAVAYLLTKKDDLLGQRDSSGAVIQTNNGSTRHTGLEMGLGRQLQNNLRMDVATSYAVHRYLNWRTTSADHSGREVEASPRLLSNMRLIWQPAAGAQAQLEWVRLGAYFLDAENRYGKYAGHDLFNLRLQQKLDRQWLVFARITNLLDRRYADSATASSSGALYAPGLPRAAYFGAEAKW